MCYRRKAITMLKKADELRDIGTITSITAAGFVTICALPLCAAAAIIPGG